MPADIPAVYRGRFAPSPTGPLHAGSLLAAVGSFLDARSRGGEWLVRMEDLDPPRELAGAAADILRTLELYGLEWDGPVLYQSERIGVYREMLDDLLSRGLAFRCRCSRADIADANSASGYSANRYPGTCRYLKITASQAHAVRLRVTDTPVVFADRVQGPQATILTESVGDFVIQRKDGLAAYQLAVVVDDGFQRITDVVRGTDLLDSTPRQIYLHGLLDLPSPRHLHLPIIVNKAGDKLSKQTGAVALPRDNPSEMLHRVLCLLRHPPPGELAGASPEELLVWATAEWDPARLVGMQQIPGLDEDSSPRA